MGLFSRYGQNMLAVYEARLNQVWCANIACRPHPARILCLVAIMTWDTRKVAAVASSR
ncbi:hypothetical protein [Loktanella sp. PT4BL]|uniref:hypothetical protein n=1 Tax=Loktanella sp. PT4BL TaxID=2135611 RepID=UPI001C64E45F|nr:hypothetical protein [Loktanella sp. PT4BL]